LSDNRQSRFFDNSADGGALFIKENYQLIFLGEVLRLNLLDQFVIALNRKDCHNASMDRNCWQYCSKEMAKLRPAGVLGPDAPKTAPIVPLSLALGDREDQLAGRSPRFSWIGPGKRRYRYQ